MLCLAENNRKLIRTNGHPALAGSLFLWCSPVKVWCCDGPRSGTQFSCLWLSAVSLLILFAASIDIIIITYYSHLAKHSSFLSGNHALKSWIRPVDKAVRRLSNQHFWKCCISSDFLFLNHLAHTAWLLYASSHATSTLKWCNACALAGLPPRCTVCAGHVGVSGSCWIDQCLIRSLKWIGHAITRVHAFSSHIHSRW